MVSTYEDEEIAVERSRYNRALNKERREFYDSTKNEEWPLTVDLSKDLKDLDLEPVVSRQVLPRTVIHKIYEPSTKSIEELKLITLDELQPHTVHSGRYLLVYLSGPAIRAGSINTKGVHQSSTYSYMPIRDRELAQGKAGVYLELHNCFVRRPIGEFLPSGTTLRIKEPFYTLCTSASTETILVRVDHPSDVEILYPYTAVGPEEDWQALGNAAFKSKKYYHAVACYTTGIKLAIESGRLESINLRSNRAAAYLEIGRYDSCIEDCNAILSREVHDKAHYRRAKASYKLQRWSAFDVDETKINDDVFTEYCSKNPLIVTGAVQDLLRSIDVRLQEKRGSYSWSSVQQEAQNNDYLDRSEYQHTALEITNIEGAGHGVRTLQNLKKGTLLCVSKASAIVYTDDKQAFSSIRVDTVRETCHLGPENELAPLLTQYMYDNPSRKRGIYDLYPGRDYDLTAPHENNDTVDAFRMQGIIAHNSFASDSSEVQMSCLPTRRSSRLHKASTGVWRYPSYFNHSCLNNCSRIFVKDLLVIKAARDIETSEELTLGYVNKLRDFSARRDVCASFGFTCVCALCKLEVDEQRKCPNELKRRNTLITDLQEGIAATMLVRRATNEHIRKTKQMFIDFVDNMKQSYIDTGRNKMQYGLVAHLNALCDLGLQSNDPLLAMRAAEEMSALCDPHNATDDYELDVYTLLVALRLKVLFGNPKSSTEALDQNLAIVVDAWQVRGLHTDFGGYWDEFGEWFTEFLNLKKSAQRLEQTRYRVSSAFSRHQRQHEQASAQH